MQDHNPKPAASNGGATAISIGEDDDDADSDWLAALDEYKELTGFDLLDEESDLFKRFAHCSESREVFSVLDDLARTYFRAYRRSSKGISTKRKFQRALDKIIGWALVVPDIGGDGVRCIAVYMQCDDTSSLHRLPRREERQSLWHLGSS